MLGALAFLHDGRREKKEGRRNKWTEGEENKEERVGEETDRDR